MKTVSIKNEYIAQLDSLEIGVVLSLNYLATSNTEIMFNNSFIQYLLYEECKNEQRTDKDITDAIQSLIAKGIINVIYATGKGKNCNYVISNENIYIDNSKDTYTHLDFKWVQKCTNNNPDTLKVLLAIASSFNNETRVGYYSQENYCKNYNIAERTFIRHLQALEDMNVLYVKRNGTYNFDGDIRSLNNNYGLVDNVKNVNNVATEHVNKVLGANGMAVNRNSNEFDGRKIKARYNAYINGSTKWDVDELKADCIRYNEYYSKFGGNTKYIDLSVFDNEALTEKVEDTRDSVDRAIDEINDFFSTHDDDSVEERATFTMEDVNELFGGSIQDDEYDDLFIGGTYEDYVQDASQEVNDYEDEFINAMNEFYENYQ